MASIGFEVGQGGVLRRRADLRFETLTVGSIRTHFPLRSLSQLRTARHFAEGRSFVQLGTRRPRSTLGVPAMLPLLLPARHYGSMPAHRGQFRTNRNISGISRYSSRYSWVPDWDNDWTVSPALATLLRGCPVLEN